MDNRNLGFGHGSEGYNNHNFVPNGEPAENTQGQNVFFQNDEWAYRLAASLQCNAKDKLAPQVRLYYAAMQRQILQRRGINMPPNNDN